MAAARRTMNRRPAPPHAQELWCKKGPPSAEFVSMYRAIMQVGLLGGTAAWRDSWRCGRRSCCGCVTRGAHGRTAARPRQHTLRCLCPTAFALAPFPLALLQPQHPDWGAPRPPPPPPALLGSLVEAADAVGRLVQYRHQASPALFSFCCLMTALLPLICWEAPGAQPPGKGLACLPYYAAWVAPRCVRASDAFRARVCQLCTRAG